MLFEICFSTCKFNPNVQGKGETFLQGIWQQTYVAAYSDGLLEYTQHCFKFTCDSFYVQLNTRLKVVRNADSCHLNKAWIEYAKGTYFLHQDTLFLMGTFTNTTGKQKISGCYRIGQYLPAFIIKSKNRDRIHLENIYEHVPVFLTLKKRIVCQPKPL